MTVVIVAAVLAFQLGLVVGFYELLRNPDEYPTMMSRFGAFTLAALWPLTGTVLVLRRVVRGWRRHKARRLARLLASSPEAMTILAVALAPQHSDD